MKTNTIKGLIAGICILLSAYHTKAQCVDVDNQLACSVRVHITLYNNCGTPPTPCNTMPIVMNLPPFSGPVAVTCTPCSTPCNVVVTLVQANGVPVPNSSADFSTASPGNSSSVPAACGPSAWIYYDGVANSFVIN